MADGQPLGTSEPGALGAAASPSKQESSSYWSSKSVTGYAPNWFTFCADLISKRILGEPGLSPTIETMRRAGKVPARSLLEIGCLNGKKVVNYVNSGLAREAAGIDYAAEAIRSGKELFGDRIDLHVVDLNNPQPLFRKFDVILANGVMHHIANFEVCAQWLKDHLAHDGVIIASEYTGPQRYRYSQHEIALINRAVTMLPEELRNVFDPCQLDIKLDADPSESIRSRDIPDVLRATGFSVQATPFGGNVLQRALSTTFFANFDANNSAHVHAVERLIAFEDEVLRHEPSHHMHILARHRDL